ncbi:hypothetical protein K3495_g159 [Podosphaera aphanis]|nr:hypothetical protein K3495_g159 [Podosphaera aphanis]
MPKKDFAFLKLLFHILTAKINQIGSEDDEAANQLTGIRSFALSLRELDLLLDESMQQLATVQVGDSAKGIPKDADPKSYLLQQYHDFIDVLDRKQANTLPPHRPWDHPIDLQPEKVPPAARSYSMNIHELEALRR